MQKDLILVIITLAAVALSVVVDRKRTAKGIVNGLQMLFKLLPQFLLLIIFVSVFLTVVPSDDLATLLSQSSTGVSAISAAFIGSVALIPGPIAYPLVGMLYQKGVPVTIIAVFITTLTMVGIFTFPIEKEYLGFQIAILRNILSFLGAMIIGFTVGALL
nr:hypothetical protein [uncultured Desulfobacter sp.]